MAFIKAPNQHPQAKLIPDDIWFLFFGGELEDYQLRLMQIPSSQLIENLPSFIYRNLNERQKQTIWFAIAYSHSDMSDEALLDISQRLNLTPQAQFDSAVYLGRLGLFDLVIKNDPTHLLEKIQNENYAAMSLAAKHGHLDIFNRLFDISKVYPNQFLEQIKANNYEAFQYAAQGDYLNIMERMMELMPNQIQAMIEANNYQAFQQAAHYGHMVVLNRLIALIPADKLQAMVASDNYAAFRLAGGTGQLVILKRLANIFPDQIQSMIKAKGEYDANVFPSAATGNHLDVMNYLVECSDKADIPAMITAGDYKAFIDGNLGTKKYLMDLAPDQIQVMVSAQNYLAFQRAVQRGCKDSIEWLATFIPADVQFRGIVENTGYTAVSIAIQNGHLDVIRYLTGIAPDVMQAMPDFSRKSAFQHAASYGLLESMEYLMELYPNQIQMLIGADNNQALRNAACDGHLDIIDRLVELVPGQIEADRYGVFEYAVSKHNVTVIDHLLSLSANLFAYAEYHQHEYHQYTKPFADGRVASLRAMRSAIETDNPHAVFDIINSNEKRLYFYILRNLIRRNNPLLRDDIQFLTELPSVRALLHTEVTAGEPNELLRLALTLGNRDAAAILLNISTVYALAEQNDFYQQEQQGQFDLRALACDNESSMRALSTGEQKRLDTALKRYQPIIKEIGVEPLFDSFKTQLIQRYLENPAHILIDNHHQEITLPVTWQEFDALDLSVSEKERALIAYYQQKDHTVLRYLSKPNAWMAPNASFVEVDPENSSNRWSTFQGYKDLIVMLWLSAKDEEVIPIDGFTLETRINHFIDELALLGRAHNWDEKRILLDAENYPVFDDDGNLIEEEYDNLQGDKPSCYSGVKRRLFQSVLGHPMLKIVTLDDIKQELRDFIRDYFRQHITEDNRASLKAAWEKLCTTNKFDPVLNVLHVTPEAQNAFIQSLSKKYSAQFDDEPTFSNYIKNSFVLNKIFQAHVVRFASETDLEGLLKPPILPLSPSSILKAKSRLNLCGKPGIAVMNEINCLIGCSQSETSSQWGGSIEKLTTVIAAVNALSADTKSDEQLIEILSDQESDLYKALFKPLSTNAVPADELSLSEIAACVGTVEKQAHFK